MLSEAEDDLAGLPETPEVRTLRRRWSALRTVVHGVGIRRLPTVTSLQESEVIESAVSFRERGRCGPAKPPTVIRPNRCVDCWAAAPETPNGDDTSIFTRAGGWSAP
jgi:hypothetical protein